MTNKELQYKLRKILNLDIAIDGIVGKQTIQAVKKFQEKYGLVIDGIAGRQTKAKLEEVYDSILSVNTNLLTFGKKRFVVFVDAGHGGIDDNGKYTTAGKRAHHKGTQLHRDGDYYEGYENRIIAEMFIDELVKLGIPYVRTYHPHRDTPLSQRVELIKGYLDRGYYGYLHSFHSNAISMSNSAEKLENTRGFIVFTTRDNNLSDQIATIHYNYVKEEFNRDWILRSDKRKDNDPDFEANFKILRSTDLDKYNDRFGAILEEWGFHTSKTDCQFITDPKNRKRRVGCAISTAEHIYNQMTE